MTSGTNEDWLKANEEQLDNSPLPHNKPPIDEVDTLADELANSYNNQGYRTWYCGVIYEFGIEKVHYWQHKASGGEYPGKLFGYYVRQARRGNTGLGANGDAHPPVNPSDSGTVYSVRGNEPDKELLSNIDEIFFIKDGEQ